MNKNMNIDNDDRMLEELGLTKESPMQVPKDYFEDLASRVMERIDMEEQSEKTAKVVSMNRNNGSIWKYAMKWTVAAAACMALVFLGVNYYEDNADTLAQNNATEEYDDEYGEEMMSYSMMDEQDVYCYLAGLE